MKIRKNIFITGSGTGIGRAITEQLLSEDYFIYACVKEDEHPILWETNPQIKILKFDVTRSEEVKSAIHQNITLDSPIDVVINCAGISAWSPMIDIPEDIFQNVMQTNLNGTWNVIRFIFPYLNKNGSKTINISSVSGELIFPFMGPYNISKAAVEALTHSYRRELIANEMNQHKVIIIQPGSIHTTLWDRAKKMEIFPKSSLFYNTAFTKVHHVIRREMAHYTPPETIAILTSKILKTSNPKIKYLIGPEKISIRLLMLLPDFIFDKIVYYFLKNLKI